MRFLNDITLGRYIPGGSSLHRLDARLKMGGALILMAVGFSLSSLGGVFLHSAMLLFLVRLSEIPLAAFFRGLRVFLWLFLLTAALHLLFTPGDALVRIGPFSITREGVAGGGLTAWRLLAAIALSALLTHTTTPLEITRAMEWFLAPLSRPLRRTGLPIQDLALMMMMALRFIPVLADEAQRVFLAQKARGADPSQGPLASRARALLALLLPLFAGVFRRSDDLALALESRGFVPGRARTSFHAFAWGQVENLAVGLGILWVAGAASLG